MKRRDRRVQRCLALVALWVLLPLSAQASVSMLLPLPFTVVQQEIDPVGTNPPTCIGGPTLGGANVVHNIACPAFTGTVTTANADGKLTFQVSGTLTGFSGAAIPAIVVLTNLDLTVPLVGVGPSTSVAALTNIVPGSTPDVSVVAILSQFNPSTSALLGSGATLIPPGTTLSVSQGCAACVGEDPRQISTLPPMPASDALNTTLLSKIVLVGPTPGYSGPFDATVEFELNYLPEPGQAWPALLAMATLALSPRARGMRRRDVTARA